MKKSSLIFLTVIALSALIFSGCLAPMPQTADEFRRAVPGALSAKVETFEVNRNFIRVVNTFKKKAPKCLNQRIRTESRTNNSYQVLVAKWNPTVVISKDRVSLHLQRHYEQGVMNIRQEPEGGYYLLVVDAYPIGLNKTRVELYRPAIGFKHLIAAIKGWASGKNTGCPDLTK